MYDSKLLATRVLLCRRDMNWDQDQLAAKSGVSRPYISQIERARKTNISVDVLFSLASALEVSMSYLLGLDDDPLGEGAEKVLREQSEGYVVFEAETTDQRRTLQQLIDQYAALTPQGQRQALQFLRIMRQIEEEERAATQTPPPRIIGDQ